MRKSRVLICCWKDNENPSAEYTIDLALLFVTNNTLNFIFITQSSSYFFKFHLLSSSCPNIPTSNQVRRLRTNKQTPTHRNNIMFGFSIGDQPSVSVRLNAPTNTHNPAFSHSFDTDTQTRISAKEFRRRNSFPHTRTKANKLLPTLNACFIIRYLSAENFSRWQIPTGRQHAGESSVSSMAAAGPTDNTTATIENAVIQTFIYI